MPLRPSRGRLLGALAALALLTPACSAGGGTPPAAAPPPVSGSPTATDDEPLAPSADPSAASPTPSAGTTAAAPVPTLTIAGFDYEVPASVESGARVQVVNEDAEAHTVTLRGGGAPLVVQPGATATFTAPSRAREWEVVCDFHAGMTATLVVV